jgi:hypothetical protein
MHWLPNVDSLVVKAGWDQQIIRAASKLESSLHKKTKPKKVSADPAADPFWIDNGGFHCTVTHSMLFAIVVSLVIALFSIHYALFAFVAILAHYAADIGSTVGLPILWPLSRRKYTLALFRDTGWWGKEMLLGFYRQPMPWLLEGGVVLFLSYRLWTIA